MSHSFKLMSLNVVLHDMFVTLTHVTFVPAFSLLKQFLKFSLGLYLYIYGKKEAKVQTNHHANLC